MKIKYLFFFVCTLLLMACTKDFEKINTDPYNPDHLDQPQLLLPAIERNASTNYFSNTLSRAVVVCDYHQDYFTSMFGDAFSHPDVERYYFSSLTDVQNIINSTQDGTQPHLLAIGYILKSWMYQVMTDLYGDFPYSQALKDKTDGIKYPAYDTQESIYYDLINKLNQADSLLVVPSKETISKDILLNNDLTKWQKFANGLRIRLLMRISNTSNVKINIAQKLQEMVSNPTKYPLPESNEDNVVFTFLNESGNYAPCYGSNPANFTLDNFLTTTLGDNLKTLNDPRIHIYASPTSNSAASESPAFNGVPNCITQADAQKYNGSNADNSTMSNLFLPRSIDPTLASPTAAQTIILTYAEVQLNLAEAKERGLITTGNAATYYNSGINASFQYWASRIPTNFTYPTASDVLPAPTYFTQPAVEYTGTQNEKLKKIYTQKWLALYFCGFEGWSEWRRTGVPTQISTTPPKGYSSSSNISEWPRRIPYPTFEQTYNNENYNKAVTEQGPDNMTTHIWWNK